MRLEEQQYKRMFMTEEEHSILIENTERYTKWKDLKIDNGSRRAYCCNKEMKYLPDNLNKALTKNIFTISSNKLLFV